MNGVVGWLPPHRRFDEVGREEGVWFHFDNLMAEQDGRKYVGSNCPKQEGVKGVCHDSMATSASDIADAAAA